MRLPVLRRWLVLGGVIGLVYGAKHPFILFTLLPAFLQLMLRRRTS